MKGRFASNTKVTTDRSMQHIEKLLKKYGATNLSCEWKQDQIVVTFKYGKHLLRIEVPLPGLTDEEIILSKKGKPQTLDKALQIHQQAIRQRWRALLLLIKAKLEAIELGIGTFETEFLAHIVLPNNLTLAQQLQPQWDNFYLEGMPLLLNQK
jgi:hypothetical protein